ncbi:Multidrug efflux pump subunit AcrA (membrane-fusion protein) [Arenibacter nanhaiticus]|uniref:Multidrug efflux pump subunit AcrA (Membrane-fusion protein) n=2 Tax=Arenibacter nanhaiticus TaxID=558155 RepID=A0A1M6JAS2_9FLAO|nr:Multidrug efflux pump subunit AcrA (membrane-fusion protein) [Arenibacter nanhaiticus]
MTYLMFPSYFFSLFLPIAKLLMMRYLFCVLLIYNLLSCGDQQERMHPTKGMLTESVYASVTIQPDSLYQAYASVVGIVERNLVEEGHKVAKGDPILQIINSALLLSTENARLALELSRENYKGPSPILKDLEEEMAAAASTLKNDSINYERQKKLWNQRIGSKIEFDSRKLAYALSQNKLNLLKSNYGRTKKELENKVLQADNTYKSAQISSQDFTIRSKINGKVYALYKNQGEIVNTMEPLAAIGSDSVFIIDMLVDEVDIVKLALGQKAFISLDAYANQVFTATVSKIYPRKDERSQTFKVEAIFNQMPKVLYPGLAGEGNIIIAQKDNALTIPKEYLLPGNKVQTDHGIVEVTVGLQNLERVEILKGINEHTSLLKPKE